MRERGRHARPAVLALALLVMASACERSSLDLRRETLCRRAVPAIVPAGARATLLRVGSGPGRDSVRVDYRLSGAPQGETKQRWIVCGFGPGASLDAVTTESGPVSGASVYLLKHYYLDSPEALAADPGTTAP